VRLDEYDVFSLIIYQMKNQKIAYIFAGLSVLGWSTVATAFKLALKYQSPESLLFLVIIDFFYNFPCFCTN
jgi:hypothetical protein